MLDFCGRAGELNRTSARLELPLELAPELRVRPSLFLGFQGQPCSQFYLVESGYFALRQLGRDRQERLVALLGPGDCFGEEALQQEGRWQVSAEALSHGAVRLIAARNLARFAQHYPQMLQTILGQLSARIEREYRRMDLMHSADAKTRAFGLLHLLATQYGEPRDGRIWLEMPLSQGELADLVGLRRETMSRVLGTLSADGMIQRRGRRGLWVNATYALP